MNLFVSEMSNPNNDGVGPSERAPPETEEQRKQREAQEAYYFQYLQAPQASRGRSPPPAQSEEEMDEQDDDNAGDDDAGEDPGDAPGDNAGDDGGDDPEYNATGGDDTTTSGAETTDGTGATEARRLARSERRRRNKVSAVQEAFDEVDLSGLPTKPDKLAKGYGNNIGAILRANVSLNTGDLRAKENEHLATLLLTKLHARYKFPSGYINHDLKGNVVNNRALGKFSKALSTWRSDVRAELKKPDGAGLPEIRRRWPQISDGDLATFKAKSLGTSSQSQREYMKGLREKNLATHNLGSRGYAGKQPIWRKEDDAIRAAGGTPEWDNIEDPLAKNFLRAHYHRDPKTKLLVTTPKVVELRENLVRNLHELN